MVDIGNAKLIFQMFQNMYCMEYQDFKLYIQKVFDSRKNRVFR